MKNMTEMEFIEHTQWDNKCWFDFDASSVDNGLCIKRVSEYIYEEGWDDEDDPVPGDVVLPDSIDGWQITEIGEWAFDREPGILSLRVPDCLQIVREWGLGGRNHKFTILSLPNQLRIAERGSFSGKTFLEDRFPETLMEIEDEAFLGCGGLKTVCLHEGLKMLGDKAFSNCPDLIHVSLPASLSLVGNDVFSGCSRLQSACLHEGMKMIGEGTFRDCQDLEHVILPASLSVVGEGIFRGCVKLRNIELSADSEALSLDGNALIRNEDQTLIAWTSCDNFGVARIPIGIRRIGAHAFSNRTDITSVIFPDSLIEIGHGGFEGCSSLRNIVFGSGLVCIGPEAFKDCTSLMDVKLPDGVVEIGYGGFEGCISLREIAFGNGIVCIGGGAFKDCASVTDIKLPDSVTRVEGEAFANCKRLKRVSVSHRVEFLAQSSFRGCSISDFVVRGISSPPAISLKALVDGSLHCSVEVYAMLIDQPYRFFHEDGQE